MAFIDTMLQNHFCTVRTFIEVKTLVKTHCRESWHDNGSNVTKYSILLPVADREVIIVFL